MDFSTVLYILLALAVVLIIWAARRAWRSYTPTEKPFVDRETARAFDKMLGTPLRPEDVPPAVTRRLGPLPRSRSVIEAAPSSDGSSALVSGLVGYHANSTLLGTLAGGDPIAAAIGDALRPDEPPSEQLGQCERPPEVIVERSDPPATLAVNECRRADPDPAPVADADPDPEPAAETAEADTDSSADNSSTD